ncbi:MAG TPA: PhzF family phenazine biosynthesis protein, partial [Planctomycetia bacterium]|nr:PhzF family phenazine biosynthesis protein [Planctomycetia bacterium]
MSALIYQVDAFTDRPFAGNPAGVCILPSPRPAEWYQQVAAEMNLAETAFLVPAQSGWNLRWFTPTVEVDLCGHGTLAAAHVLYETGALPEDRPVEFYTRSGALSAAKVGSAIELDFPSEPASVPAGETLSSALCAALGVSPRKALRNRLDVLLELDSDAAVRDLDPDFGALAQVDTRGLIVTARAAEGRDYDFVSRFFAPAAGILEDPVTGSAHCALAPYWSAKLGRDRLVGYQASRRGGYVRVKLAGDRVRLLGRAVTVFRAEWFA